MSSTFSLFYSIVQRIPAGKAASYGQIAMLSGDPRRSRAVGYALRACTDACVPCHRVVMKDGSLSPHFGPNGSAEQHFLLKSEGVCFLPDGRVDMTTSGWRP